MRIKFHLLFTFFAVLHFGWNINLSHGADSDAVVLDASSCEELRSLFESIHVKKHIYISSNLGCTREQWSQPILVTNHTWIEGRRFGKGIPAIDWSDFTSALVLQENIAITFVNVLLIQDFITLGSLKLSFLTGYPGSTVHVMGVGVGIRSCGQRLENLVPVFQNIQRPSGSYGNQRVSEIDEDTIFVENVAFYPPRGDNSTWAVCRSMYQCNVNSPDQKSFQSNLIKQRMEPSCGRQLETSAGYNSAGTSGSSSSSSNGTFAAIVALVTAILTALVLVSIYIIVKFVVLPLFKREKSKARDTPTPDIESVTDYTTNPRKQRSRQTSSVSLLNTALQLTDIELGVPLGRGELSTVYKGYFNNKPLAVKVVDVEASECVHEEDDPVAVFFANHYFDFNVAETLLYQTHRVEDLYGPGVLRESDFSRSRNPMDTLSSINEIRPSEVYQYRTFHVMEFCNLGSLAKAVNDGIFQTQENTPRMIIVLRSALDIAKGMKYLHSVKMIHGQLRPSNVLLKGDALDARGFICKVADFGLSHWRQTQQALEVNNGAQLSYRAPEALRKGTVEYGSDVFSFGMILWTMLSGSFPFSGFDAAETAASILEGARPEIPPSAPRAYQRLIKDCWHAEISARPPFSNIIDRLGKIISDVVRSTEANGTSNQSRRRLYSSSDTDTLLYGGSATTENPLDTIEIHETSSGYRSGSVSPTGSHPFWEQFQNTTSPLSTKSEVVLPSFDLTQTRLPRRTCNSWDETQTASVLGEPVPERTTVQGTVASKPSETVSLRYGIASGQYDSQGSIGSSADILSSDPYKKLKPSPRK